MRINIGRVCILSLLSISIQMMYYSLTHVISSISNCQYLLADAALPFPNENMASHDERWPIMHIQRLWKLGLSHIFGLQKCSYEYEPLMLLSFYDIRNDMTNNISHYGLGKMHALIQYWLLFLFININDSARTSRWWWFFMLRFPIRNRLYLNRSK